MSDYEIRTARVGFSVSVGVFKDGEYVVGFKNLLTEWGARREGKYLVDLLLAGATAEQLWQENEDERAASRI